MSEHVYGLYDSPYTHALQVGTAMVLKIYRIDDAYFKQ